MRLLLLLIPFFLFAVPSPKGRPSSAPFISGDTFRYFADFVYDELDTSLDPARVTPGSTLFVKTDYLPSFFAKIHPAILHPYILITHNSDHPAPGPFAHHLDDPKLLAWFAQNFDGFSHSKIHPIPIGLANAHWKHGNVEKVREVQEQNRQKKHLLYLNISVSTFSEERKKLFDYFSSLPFCHQRTNRPYEKFLKDIASSVFIVSPRGNGLDTHRLWEVLYLRSIPIVKTSSLDPLYQNLPVLIVENWEDVTEELLQKKRAELALKRYDLKELTIDYWLKEIDSVKRNTIF